MCQCSLQYFSAGGLFLKIRARRVGRAKNADQPWKRESLTDQGHQDYAECKKDDQIALRKRATICQCLRQCDGCGECNHAAHTSPAQDQDARRRWRSDILVNDVGTDPLRDERAWKNPDHPKCNDQPTEQGAIQNQHAQTVALDSSQHIMKLQADKHEHETI